MRPIAYLVLAHDSPRHLGRLLDAVSSANAHTFVHLDASSDIDGFVHVERAGVELIRDRVDVVWGDFSQVDAILVLLRAAFAHELGFDRFVLISGTDYPIRSAGEIERYFDNHADVEFINLTEIPDDAMGKPITRLTTYQPRPGRTRTGRAARDLLMRVGRRVHRRDYRTRLGGLAPFGGSTWWALTRQSCEHILDFVEDHPDVVSFFHHAVCPDETLVHTIIANTPHKTSVQPNLTWVDWTSHGANPAKISAQHLPRLTQLVAGDDHRYLFVRKFADTDGPILDHIDHLIAKRTAGEPSDSWLDAPSRGTASS